MALGAQKRGQDPVAVRVAAVLEAGLVPPSLFVAGAFERPLSGVVLVALHCAEKASTEGEEGLGTACLPPQLLEPSLLFLIYSLLPLFLRLELLRVFNRPELLVEAGADDVLGVAEFDC